MKWILGACLLLLIGIIGQLGLLVYAMYVLLGVLLASRHLARRWIDGLSVTRAAVSGTLEIGQAVQVQILIENQGRLPVPWLLLEDSVPREALIQNPPALRITGATLRLLHLRGQASQSVDYQVEFLRRGYYQLGPALIESGDLFGLHRRYRVETEPTFVTVLPKVVPLEGYDLSSRRPVGEIRIMHRLFEDPTRISGVRLYEMGDPLNRVHWRATARTGKLHSKLYEPSCMAGATLLLDFHRESYHGRGAHYCAELAVTAAASLANAVQLMQQPVGLITNGRDAADRIRDEGWNREFSTRALARSQLGLRPQNDRLRPVVVPTQRGPEQFSQILETLARLELTDGMAFPQLVIESASRLPRNSSVVAILAEVTPEAALALGSLRRRGYAVTGIVIVFDEPGTPEWARRPDWSVYLLQAGVEVRRIDNEQAIASLCSEKQVRGLN